MPDRGKAISSAGFRPPVEIPVMLAVVETVRLSRGSHERAQDTEGVWDDRLPGRLLLKSERGRDHHYWL